MKTPPKPDLTGRIFRAVCMAALVVFLASLVFILGVLYDYFIHSQQNQLKTLTELSAHSMIVEGSEYFTQFDENSEYRVTWISPEGKILYDSSSSNAEEMENHLEREEITEALESGYGESGRYSSTLFKYCVYSAVRLGDGSVLRLSCEQYTILTLILGMLQPIAIVIGAAIAISLYLAYRLSRNIVSPLNSLNLNEPLSNDVYEELTPLLVRIDSQQQHLKLQRDELERKQKEFSTAVTNMNEGFVLLGRRGSIVMMNPSACRILGLSEKHVGCSIRDLALDAGIIDVIDTALASKRSESVISMGSRYYEINSSPIITDDQLTGAVLLLFDVTERVNSEELRREFTSNVSHELKTPLHSISGYAELMAHGIARQEDMRPFSEKIYAEAQRMMHLVEDILHLSRLDDGGEGMNRSVVSLNKICEEVIENLASAAELNEVSLSLESDGEHLIEGIPHLLHGIAFNLCDNAVKYNRRGGSVKVSLSSDEDSVILNVTDTGIGIAGEHADRIFERFYRVDKSHSKAVGGTGLGLSIVKHAAKIHSASIELDSEIGKGTSITVRFPKPVL